MPVKEENSEPLYPHRWVVFGVVASIYFLVYFHRVSTSVIATDLLAAFETNATALGFMSSMYFYLYAFEQPIVGHLSDRLGARRVVGLWSLTAALGCILFGLAPTIGWASVGRAFIGFGVGGVYVPAMKAFSQWFRKKEFAVMIGLLLASGNLGAIVATTPLAWMANVWGWRSSFLVIGGVTLGLALITLFLVRDHPGKSESERGDAAPGEEQTASAGVSAFQVLSSLRFWVLGAIFFGIFGGSIAFQGLWATPFLMTILKLDRLQASGLNMLIPVGFIIGAPLSGWLGGRVFRSRVHVLILLLFIWTGCWVALTFGAAFLGTGGFLPLLTIMGVAAGGAATTLWAIVRETTRARIFGLTSGLLNPFPLLGMAVMQGWTGAILDHTGKVNGAYPPQAYREAFLVCLLIAAFCLVLCVWFRKGISSAQ
jgi:sugar phosphate permease